MRKVESESPGEGRRRLDRASKSRILENGGYRAQLGYRPSTRPTGLERQKQHEAIKTGSRCRMVRHPLLVNGITNTSKTTPGQSMTIEDCIVIKQKETSGNSDPLDNDNHRRDTITLSTEQHDEGLPMTDDTFKTFDGQDTTWAGTTAFPSSGKDPALHARELQPARAPTSVMDYLDTPQSSLQLSIWESSDLDQPWPAASSLSGPRQNTRPSPDLRPLADGSSSAHDNCKNARSRSMGLGSSPPATGTWEADSPMFPGRRDVVPGPEPSTSSRPPSSLSDVPSSIFDEDIRWPLEHSAFAEPTTRTRPSTGTIHSLMLNNPNPTASIALATCTATAGQSYSSSIFEQELPLAKSRSLPASSSTTVLTFSRENEGECISRDAASHIHEDNLLTLSHTREGELLASRLSLSDHSPSSLDYKNPSFPPFPFLLFLSSFLPTLHSNPHISIVLSVTHSTGPYHQQHTPFVNQTIGAKGLAEACLYCASTRFTPPRPTWPWAAPISDFTAPSLFLLIIETPIHLTLLLSSSFPCHNLSINRQGSDLSVSCFLLYISLKYICPCCDLLGFSDHPFIITTLLLFPSSWSSSIVSPRYIRGSPAPSLWPPRTWPCRTLPSRSS